MARENRPFLFIPALLAAIVVAVVFFKGYGWLTRPKVPRQIAALVDLYAPGVAISKSVKESSARLRDRRWVRGLGFVGAPTGGPGFAQARLLLSPHDRDEPSGRERSIVEAVEIVSDGRADFTRAAIAMGGLFRSVPKDGCLVPARPEMPFRRVQYWTTPNDRGGAAMVSDWATESRPSATRGVAVWSIVAWAGKFEGARTLRGHFVTKMCPDAEADAPSGVKGDATTLAGEDLTLELGGVATAQFAERKVARAPLSLDERTAVADACFQTATIQTSDWERRDLGAIPVSILMPPEYARWRRGRYEEDSVSQIFRTGDDNTLSIGRTTNRQNVESKRSECDVNVYGVPVHIEIGGFMEPSGRYDRRVTASYELPTGGWMVIRGAARDVARQQQQLRMVHEVVFKQFWNAPRSTMTPTP